MRILWIGLLASACAEQQVERADAPEPSEGSAYWGPSNIYDEDPQCRDLLGPVPDTLTNREAGQTYVSFPLMTTDGQTVSISTVGTLSIPSGTMQGKDLQMGTNDVSVRITGVVSDGVRDTYTLKYWTKSDLTLRDYCPPGEFATALAGEWKASAFRIASPPQAPRVTFGCSGSAMRKCYGWGYVPPREVTNTTTQTAWRAHQACTRMARADYCGIGEPGTRPKTPIVIRDYLPGYRLSPSNPLPTGEYPLFHATTFPPPPDRIFYESAWTWRENEGAMCMERHRWASVGPLTCPNLVNPSLDKTGKFCSELGGDDAIINLGGMLVNGSKTQDIEIAQWRNPKTGDTVSTVRGFWREDHGDPVPFEGYTQRVERDGILLRNPPYSLTPKDVVPVFSAFAAPDDRALLPDDGLDPDQPSFEGYMLHFRNGVTRFKTFTRVKPDGTTDTTTSIGPDERDWQEAGNLEYVLTAPAQDIE